MTDENTILLVLTLEHTQNILIKYLATEKIMQNATMLSIPFCK